MTKQAKKQDKPFSVDLASADKDAPGIPVPHEGKDETLLDFLDAEKILELRWGATQQEIAMWVFLSMGSKIEIGSNKGVAVGPVGPVGLDGCFGAQLGEKPQKFSFSDYKPGFDYLVELMNCHFKQADLDKFVPANRYLTYSQLIERWRGRCSTKKRAVAYIKAKCESEELNAYYPVVGIIDENNDDAGGSYHVDGLLQIEDGMFSESEVKSIEAEHPSHAANTDKSKTDAANRSRANEQAVRREALASFVRQTIELGRKKRLSWAEAWDHTKILPSQARQFTALFFEKYPSLKRQQPTTIQADLKPENIKFTPGRPAKGMNTLATLWASKSPRETP